MLAFMQDNPLGEYLFNDETKVEASFKRLRKSLERLTDRSRAGQSWRRSVFDAREHVTFRAVEGGQTPPAYGCVVLDEGFAKADSDYTGRALRALQELGFQLIIGAPARRPPRSRTSSTWSPTQH